MHIIDLHSKQSIVVRAFGRVEREGSELDFSWRTEL